jgi:hypothetical protein
MQLPRLTGRNYIVVAAVDQADRYIHFLDLLHGAYLR